MKNSMIARAAARFTKDQDGAVLIYTAAASAVMLGFCGLAMDVAFWYSAKRDMQSAADAAAMTAALEMARGATNAEMETRALAIALLNGYGVSDVDINNPPLDGDYAGNAAFVEAVVSQPQSGFVSGILHPDDMPVTSRAVATLAGAPACVIALNPSEQATLSVTGTADATLDCGAQANSVHDQAVSQTGGNSSMEATNINSSGGYTGSNFTPDPQTDMPIMADPFLYLTPPDVASDPCLEPAGTPKVYPSSYSGTVPAGNYCGGLKIQGADVEFETGIYAFDEVGLHITGNGTITTEDGGVTFYFQPTVVGESGRIAYIAGTTDVTLTAPTGGDYDGILFYVDPDADPSLELALKGGSDMALTGVIYAKANHVEYAGNAVANDTWTSIVADSVQFVGTSYMASTGFVGGNLPLALSSPSLAE